MARPTALALVPPARQPVPLKYSVIVCAYNEEAYLPACLHSLLAQTRRPDEIIVVNNASSDRTRAVATRIPGVRVIDEPRRGLVRAREAGRQAARGDVLVYVDADCRAPLRWLEHLVALCERGEPAAVSGSYRFYDWDLIGRVLVRLYDWSLAPLTHFVVQDVLGIGAVLYGGNFAVRRAALDRIGGFDTSIEFHGEDTNLGRRLAAVGRIRLSQACWLYTSARRYQAMGRRAVFGLYIRNFWSEILRHRPSDATHQDVRT
ncbi:MAG TPA: glycosyltransferase family 2 protein [Vicinamibacterales bacterium]|jgi:glycosyltransferase involved in cell wall biosynthesis